MFDAAALTVFLTPAARRLARHCPGVMLDWEDLVQEGVLGVWLNRGESDKLRVARNRMKDALRAVHDERPQRRKHVEIPVGGAADLTLYPTAKTDPTARSNARLDLSRRVSATPLTPRHRAVLRLLLRDYRPREISETLGVSEPRVCQLRARLFAALRNQTGGDV